MSGIVTCCRSVILVAAVVGLAAVGTVGCADTASEADCKKLLDHIIDVEVGAAGTGKLSPERKADLDKQRKAVASYLSDGFVKKCMAETPGARVRCGLEAKTPEQLAACDKE